MIPVLSAMCDWGTEYLNSLGIQSPCCSS
ncbi:MAG: hypothetical protein K2O16_11855 [Lachnospiraceae bacterium]|nr:hypothetical protein [Lachnospiraceae bacterium]